MVFLGSSVVEHLTVNQGVAGSSPARGAIHKQYTNKMTQKYFPVFCHLQMNRLSVKNILDGKIN